MAAPAIIKSYANLIIKGIKTIDDVPTSIRDDVTAYLTEIGYISNNG